MSWMCRNESSERKQLQIYHEQWNDHSINQRASTMS